MSSSSCCCSNNEDDADSELAAVAGDGSVVWTQTGALDATIAIDGSIVGRGGTVISGGTSIVALDGSTGSIERQLWPPVPGPTIWYVTLTSVGTIVAEQADGTVFGASD